MVHQALSTPYGGRNHGKTHYFFSLAAILLRQREASRSILRISPKNLSEHNLFLEIRISIRANTCRSLKQDDLIDHFAITSKRSHASQGA